MQKAVITLLLFFLQLIFLSSVTVQSAEADPTSILDENTLGEAVDISADWLEYRESEGIIVGEGKVKVTHQGMTLSADRMVFAVDQKVLQASGAVRYREKAMEVKGESLIYSLEEGLGKADDIDGIIHPWFIKARSLNKADENQFNLERSFFTTCDLPEPHYRLFARRLVVYPGERLYAYHTVFYLRGIPIFYLPVYRRSLRDVPSGWVIYPGNSSEDGWFLLSHYNWYFNPDLRGRLYFDYYQDRGWGEGMETRFRLGKDNWQGEGKFYSFFIEEEEGAGRWKLHLWQEQQFGLNKRAIFRIDRFSDGAFSRDYLDEEQWKGWSRLELENQKPQGSFSLTDVTPTFNWQLFFRKRINDFLTVREELPSFTFDWKRQTWKKTLFYYDLDANFSYLREKPGEDEVFQSDVNLELSRASRLKLFTSWRWLNLEPALETTGFWYSKDTLGRNNRLQGNYEGRLKLTTRSGIWRIYPTPNSSTFSALKHRIQPRLSYRYVPEPTTDIEKLFSFVDKLDSGRDILYLELINLLQAKKKDGEKKVLADLTMYTSYDRRQEEKRWKDIRADLEMWWWEDTEMRIEAAYDPYLSLVEALDTDFYVRRKEKEFRVGTRYYQPGGEKDVFDLETGLVTSLGPKWRFDLRSRFDLNDNRFKEERLILSRDLHCWEMQLFWQQKQEEEWETNFFILFRIKALPSMKLKLGLE